MAMVVHSSIQFKKSYYYIPTNKKKVLHPCDIKKVNSLSSQVNKEKNTYKEFWCREYEDYHRVKSSSKKQDDDGKWVIPNEEPENKGNKWDWAYYTQYYICWVQLLRTHCWEGLIEPYYVESFWWPISSSWWMLTVPNVGEENVQWLSAGVLLQSSNSFSLAAPLLLRVIHACIDLFS